MIIRLVGNWDEKIVSNDKDKAKWSTSIFPLVFHCANSASLVAQPKELRGITLKIMILSGRA